ncbi:MAG: PAS domain S-box protein [Candidatus Eisenbacteria bacterium]|nr:PAS domain S-box protein [Candidatus Eisenbacteria bacterium]
MRGNEATTRKGFLTLIYLRLLVVLAISGTGVLILHGHTDQPLRPFYALMGITTILSAVYWLAARKGKSLVFQAWVQLLADVGLATGIIHYTGGAASPFALLYILIITSGSAFLLLRGTAFLASLSAAAYGMLLAWEKGALFATSGSSFAFDSEAGRYLTLQVGLYAITFLLVALLSGYLSFRVRRGGEALAAVRSRLRQVHLDTDQILRSLSSGLLTVDREGRVVHFNRAAEQIAGLSACAVSARPCRAVFENLSPALAEMVEGIRDGGAAVARRETDLITPFGDVVPIGVSASALHDEKGGTAGVVAIFQDLTDVRKMEEQIRHADRLAAVGELSAGIAHEIRNPLATISGSIQVLQGELDVTGENRRLLELIVRESDRLHRIVEEFLDFARNRPLGRARIDLTAFLEDLVENLRAHPKVGPGVRVLLRSERPGAELAADEELLRSIFLNLTVNGAEAMGGKGELVVEVGEVEDFRSAPDSGPDRAIAVRVTDKGPGVSEEVRRNLFRPFFTTKKGGVGLGLAMAQKAALSHNGKIECTSGPEGTTFTVYLPWDGARVRESCAAGA